MPENSPNTSSSGNSQDNQKCLSTEANDDRSTRVPGSQNGVVAHPVTNGDPPAELRLSMLRAPDKDGVSLTNGEIIPFTLLPAVNVPQESESERKLDVLSDDGSAASHTSDAGREKWSSKFDFVLSTIGFAVDLSNVWRFPVYCYQNGGGAFLIPYFLMLVFGAVPLFYMEVLLGQFHRQGAISLWRIAPIFKGLGYAIVIVSFLVSIYYNVIIGWSFYYFFGSFSYVLPWSSCDNDWSVCGCIDDTYNGTEIECGNVTYNRSTGVSAAKQYFERQVMKSQLSSGMEDLGAPNWDVTLCVLLAYIVLYFALWKGVKSSGKVIYVTALMPYVILLILFVRALFLEGAVEGLLYFIKPEFSRLADAQVWIDAAVQIFYSVGPGFGCHLALASYNDFHNNCRRDCMITAVVNSFTSIFSGFVVFSYLGYMSVKNQVHISKVATPGPGLVFEVYPEAIATLPGSSVWAVFFFFMLITLGMDSSMGGIEAIVTAILDEYSQLKKRKWHREITTAVVMICSFLISLSSCTAGGAIMVTFMDTFAAGTSLLIIVLFEAIAVTWFYGLDQFLADAEKMLGEKPSFFWRICWKFVSPIFLCTIVICSAALYEAPTHAYSTSTYIYPEWSMGIGWTLAVLPLVAVFSMGLYQVYTAKGKSWSQRLAVCISPSWEHESILAEDEQSQPKRLKASHWFSMGKDFKWSQCRPTRAFRKEGVTLETELK